MKETQIVEEETAAYKDQRRFQILCDISEAQRQIEIIQRETGGRASWAHSALQSLFQDLAKSDATNVKPNEQDGGVGGGDGLGKGCTAMRHAAQSAQIMDTTGTYARSRTLTLRELLELHDDLQVSLDDNHPDKEEVLLDSTTSWWQCSRMPHASTKSPHLLSRVTRRTTLSSCPTERRSPPLRHHPAALLTNRATWAKPTAQQRGRRAGARVRR